MGIFSVWVPLGSMFIMGTSGFFFNTADPSSYHNVFWFVVVLMAIITVIWVVAVPQSPAFLPGGRDRPQCSEA